MGALGPLLRDLGSLLRDLGSLLGDLDSVLGRSWGLLARSWVVLGVQESPGQRAWRTTVGRSYPPPVGNPRFDPPGKQEKYHREEGKVPQGELRTTIGKREECTRGTKDHNREEGRV